MFHSSSVVFTVPHLPRHGNTHTHTHTSSPSLSARPLSPCPAHFTPPTHEYLPAPTDIPPVPCGTKLIEDDWFFPGCSDSALETRQQELEEELAQARGLGQHRAKKLAAPSQRSLQVGGRWLLPHIASIITHPATEHCCELFSFRLQYNVTAMR